ncbi:hypothetical protein BV22DRAFT_1041637 [Leucogyrophana mollusca]|uniref:Uncharacterized protein n=1 Tax=Leucogyrophana mollusca TaxID=85980 RepID=A0ACB8AYW6_9AGAM|nr:hypothetical protein BV22DRAFT_1041637 [Leucogyrophana mollusca]
MGDSRRCGGSPLALQLATKGVPNGFPEESARQEPKPEQESVFCGAAGTHGARIGASQTM